MFGGKRKLRERIAAQERLISDLIAANKRLTDERNSLAKRDATQRALIGALRACNATLDERNVELEGRT